MVVLVSALYSTGLAAEEIHLCGHESALPLVRRFTESIGDSLEVIPQACLSLPSFPVFTHLLLLLCYLSPIPVLF